MVAKIHGDEEQELIEHSVLSSETGEYWRLLNDGSYLVFAETDEGLKSEPTLIEVKNVAFKEAHVVNFELAEQVEEQVQDGSDELGGEEDDSEEEKFMAVIIQIFYLFIFFYFCFLLNCLFSFFSAIEWASEE